MIILLGDSVTVYRGIGDSVSFVTGQVSGIVLTDSGDLRYFFIKGIDAPFFMSDNWRFDNDNDNEEEEN